MQLTKSKYSRYTEISFPSQARNDVSLSLICDVIEHITQSPSGIKRDRGNCVFALLLFLYCTCQAKLRSPVQSAIRVQYCINIMPLTRAARRALLRQQYVLQHLMHT